MAIFKCKMCGGTIEFQDGATVGVCDSCGTKQTLPRLDSDRKANLYDRANHFRRNNEFDKAMSIYENILNEDPTDAEAYWSLVLCRYGIEYVEDPATHRRLPTVNRAQFTSIFDDEDYKSAMQNADALQRAIYEDEAKAINEIQKGILEISAKEEPFDVFICYKETDANGRRTPDSVLATDLYHQLTNEGFKIFFSRITLEDKLGQEYEPYIFAALNSAKAMVVLGTKPEHFNAVWVKNEWSRYLALIKAGAKKTLIPAYRDMDPYDLPDEFSHLQAQDMSKLGFMQDLIRGIKKLVKTDEPKQTIRETIVTPALTAATAPLLRRAFMFLEDGEWNSANEYCEKVLDIEPENAEAYLGKLMAELKVNKRDALKDQPEPFDNRNNYKKAYRFGDEKLKAELSDDIAFIKDRNETARKTGIYNDGVKAMNAASTESEYKKAAAIFKTIPGFRDADALAERCLEQAEICRKEAVYAEAKKRMRGETEGSFKKAIAGFKTIPGWQDADKLLADCEQRINEMTQKRQENEASIDDLNRKISDAEKAKQTYQTELSNLKGLFSGRRRKELETQIEAADWNISAIKTELHQLRQKQSYYKAKDLYDVEKYRDALAAFMRLHGYKDCDACIRECWDHAAVRNTIAAGWDQTVGLRSDGTVVAVGRTDYGRCDVSGWTDIIAIAAGFGHTVGLRSDGTVVAVGDNDTGRCGVSGWTDIVAIAAGDWHTVGLRSDGTVVAVGKTGIGQCDVSDWTDIVSIATGSLHTVGLRSDGTVVAVGNNAYGQRGVSGWTDIAAIAAGQNHTVGLRSDGTVVAVGRTDFGQCNVSGWTDIVAIAAGGYHTVGLRSDGTAVAVGWDSDGQRGVSGWTGIAAIAAGGHHTVGLRSDGTVVAIGLRGCGQCDVSGWKNIRLPEQK